MTPTALDPQRFASSPLDMQIAALLVAAVLAAPLFAQTPSPEDPLTLDFAHAPVPSGACDAIDQNPTGRHVAIRASLEYFLDGIPYDNYNYSDGKEKYTADITADQTAWIQCERNADGYFVYGKIEQRLVQLKATGANAARALGAFDIGIALSEGCLDIAKYPSCPVMFAYRAGALADLARFDDAFASLKKSIDAGFLAARWISHDPALGSLRQHPDWDTRINALLPPHIVPMPESISSNVSLSFFGGRGTSISYTLCTDQRLAVHTNDGGGGLAPIAAWSTGRWELKPDGIWIAIEQNCEANLNQKHEWASDSVIYCTPHRYSKPSLLLSNIEVRTSLSSVERKDDLSLPLTENRMVFIDQGEGWCDDPKFANPK